MAVKSMGINNTSARYGTSRLRIAMGTFVAIDAEANTHAQAQAGMKAAFAAIAEVERLMHPSRLGSDLQAIRQSPLGVPVLVHPWTWRVLALSQRLNQLSRGAFDPCLPAAEGRIADLALLPPGSVIRHRPLSIDLGGIAKGFAVDRAVEALRNAGCHSGLVNAGGDLAVFGECSRPILIRAGNNAAGEFVALENAALATSEVCSATQPSEHRGYYHGVDRREIDSGAVSISAPSAAVADGLTKCLLADDSASHAELLEAFGARQVACGAGS